MSRTRNVPLLVALPACLVAGCLSSDGGEQGSTRERLADAFTNTAPYQRKADECGLPDPTTFWTERELVEAAVKTISDDEAERCLRATLAYDRCALALSCDAFDDSLALALCSENDGPYEPCCSDPVSGEDIECPPDPACLEQLEASIEDCTALSDAVWALESGE